jgi:hypothetical protein
MLCLVAVILGVGCAASHEPLDVGSGIYDLRVRHEDDRCTPTRRTPPMGAVGIVSERGLVNIAVPGLEGHLSRVSLSASEGFHSDSFVEFPDCAGASLRRSWTILDGTTNGFELQLSEEWTGIAGCAAAREYAPVVPEGDCRADRVFEYRLMEACASPCEVRVVDGNAFCSCD